MEIELFDECFPETLFDTEEPRAEGTHLSDVITSLQNASGLGYTGVGFTDMELTAEVGLLWERALSKIMRDKYALRPPQICKDGIWMSPDGVSIWNNLSAMSIGEDVLGKVPLAVEEYKCTWKSIRNSLTDNFYYMCQVKSYCYAVETNVAIMRVFYINGNYKGSGPLYRIARLVFTEQELYDNWQMILRHKREMER